MEICIRRINLSQPTGVSTFANRTSQCTDQKLQKSFHLCHPEKLGDTSHISCLTWWINMGSVPIFPRSGSYRWVLVRGLAIRAPAMKPHRLAGSLTDITARKKTEHKLAEQLDYLERFQKVAVKREFRIREMADELASLKAEIAGLKRRT